MPALEQGRSCRNIANFRTTIAVDKLIWKMGLLLACFHS